MAILSKDIKAAILGASHLKTEQVEIPEWGVSVLVSEMSGVARDAFYVKREADLSVSEQQAELLLATVVDETGALILDESDIAGLRAQGAAILDRLVAVAVRINGMAPDAVDDAVKNSDAAQSGDSGSN